MICLVAFYRPQFNRTLDSSACLAEYRPAGIASNPMRMSILPWPSTGVMRGQRLGLCGVGVLAVVSE